MDHSSHNHGHNHNIQVVQGEPNPIESHGSLLSPPAGHHNTHAGHVMMGMESHFYFGTNVELLFSFWNVDSVEGIVGSCFIVFLLGFLYEALKCYRLYLQVSFRKKRAQYSVVQSVNGSGDSAATTPEETIRMGSYGICSTAHLLQTLTYGLQLVLSYFLMLIFMAYNAWICMSLILGATFGYLIFGAYRHAITVADHCT